MSTKLGIGSLASIVVLLLVQGCVFGGDDSGNFSASRPSAIPTATLPATLSEPVDLGESVAIPGSTPAEPDETTVTYLVQPGDTLNAIAGLFGVPGDQRAAWTLEVLRINGIADARLLQAGQELIIPSFGTSEDSSLPAQTPVPDSEAPTPATGSGATYTVIAGDSAILIAQKLGVPGSQQLEWAQQLLALNRVSESGLSIGQVLQLPQDTP